LNGPRGQTRRSSVEASAVYTDVSGTYRVDNGVAAELAHPRDQHSHDRRWRHTHCQRGQSSCSWIPARPRTFRGGDRREWDLQVNGAEGAPAVFAPATAGGTGAASNCPLPLRK
jgi:hypothetical protein